jgi:hypothetical protein
MAAPVKRDWNDQIGVFAQEPEAMTQSTAEICAQEWKAAEFQGVDHVDERRLVVPAGVESLERGWSSSTGATEIAIGQRIGFQWLAAASTHRPGCRLELSTAARAQSQLESQAAFDSIAGHADSREE